MSGPQYIISLHDPNILLQKYLFFEHNECSSSTHVSEEVCYLPMSFSQDRRFPWFDFQDQIGTWLENSLMNKYTLCFNDNIMFLLNRMLNELII